MRRSTLILAVVAAVIVIAAVLSWIFIDRQPRETGALQQAEIALPPDLVEDIVRHRVARNAEVAAERKARKSGASAVRLTR